MPFEYMLRTRYAETGQDGIIHHSSFVLYLEEARIAYLEKLGYSINESEKKKILCPVVDLSIKYIKPLYSLETINIEVSVESFSKVRFKLSYEILRKGVILAKAYTTNCFINESFNPIPLSADFLQSLKNAKREKTNA